jgi:hypothetical protein
MSMACTEINCLLVIIIQKRKREELRRVEYSPIRLTQSKSMTVDGLLEIRVDCVNVQLRTVSIGERNEESGDGTLRT